MNNIANIQLSLICTKKMVIYCVYSDRHKDKTVFPRDKEQAQAYNKRATVAVALLVVSMFFCFGCFTATVLFVLIKH